MNQDDYMLHPQWREVLHTIPVLLDFIGGDPDARGLYEFVRGVSRQLDIIIEHTEYNSPFVWYNLGFNAELVHALDGVCPLPVETLGVLQNLLGDVNHSLDFIDTAHAAGIPQDCCSADKLAVGAIHHGLYPDPACVIGISTPCDAQVAGNQVVAELTGAPFFPIDVPYYFNEETVSFVAGQLWELIPFLEEHTGKKLDFDRLREVCDLSNRMTETIWEWLEWRKREPLAQSSKLVAFTLILQVLFTGSEIGLDIVNGLLEEVRDRSLRGEAFFEERVRAAWYQDPVWTDMQIYDWFERDLGLTVPIDLFGYYAQEGLIDTKTPESMIRGLAKKLVVCHPMSRQFRSDIGRYVGDFLHMAEAWNVDCCIFGGHIACKHAWGGIGLFKEACRKAGIPLLIFEFDMFDPRVTPWDDVFFEVERFVNEIVYPRKMRG